MAKSRFEYVRTFERDPTLLPSCHIVVRLDGRKFHTFAQQCGFVEPHDARLAHLMNRSALAVCQRIPDIILAFGQSDEYSFLFARDTVGFQRRGYKLVSLVASCFTSAFMRFWAQYVRDVPAVYPPAWIQRAGSQPSPVDSHTNGPVTDAKVRPGSKTTAGPARPRSPRPPRPPTSSRIQLWPAGWTSAPTSHGQLVPRFPDHYPADALAGLRVPGAARLLPQEAWPMFDGRAVAYPRWVHVRAYFAWRQADTHINCLYNTACWALRHLGGCSPQAAAQRLARTAAEDKHELLFTEFRINYNHVPAIFRRGSILVRDPAARKRAWQVCHTDLIGDAFWDSRPSLNPERDPPTRTPHATPAQAPPSKHPTPSSPQA